ncbi:hypothetical protein ACFLTH_03570 [Bacteroidota bacterium]
MTLILIIFGALTMIAGIIIMINPDYIFDLIRENFEKTGMHILSILLRLALGVLLISQSDSSKFPAVLEIFGWLSIIAAIFFAVIGSKNFNRIISWALSLSKPFGRLGGFIAVCYGAFIIYALI